MGEYSFTIDEAMAIYEQYFLDGEWDVEMEPLTNHVVTFWGTLKNTNKLRLVRYDLDTREPVLVFDV